MESKKEMSLDGQLAIRILNFVAPYIPDHIREESLNIIKNETRKPAEIKDNTKHNFAHTTIQWKEDGKEEEVTFKLSPYNEVADKNIDEQIFFYCESEEEFENLKHYENGEDFVVVGCTLFTETLY